MHFCKCAAQELCDPAYWLGLVLDENLQAWLGGDHGEDVEMIGLESRKKNAAIFCDLKL